MAFRDGYDPASEDRFIELFVYALRHFGPTRDTVRLTEPDKGTKLLKKASGVRHLLRELAVYADWDTGGRCFPNEERLADALATGRDTVSGWVQDARSTGWLKVDKSNPRERHGRGWNVNRYTLVIPADIRQQAEAHAEARRQSLHPQGQAEQGEPNDREGARRQSRHTEGGESEVAPEDVGTTGEDVGTTPRARRESTPEHVGRPDTTPSVEPLKHPPKDPVNAREDGESIREREVVVVVPDDFDPAAYGLDDNKKLFALLTDAERQWAAAILTHETDYALPPDSEVSRSYELEKMPAHRLRLLQYRHNGEATS